MACSLMLSLKHLKKSQLIDFWNQRYRESHFAYGKTPNLFLAENLPRFERGELLFAAEGEGRNAVFAAQLGHHVVAYDISIEGKNKAMKLAAEMGVEIEYGTGHLEEQHYQPDSFDGLVLIYAHFPKSIRATLHAQLLNCLKPGGFVIFEAFGKEQIQYQSGGPKDVEMLVSIEEVMLEFEALSFELLENVLINLQEGAYHNGLASVVRFVGYKK